MSSDGGLAERRIGSMFGSFCGMSIVTVKTMGRADEVLSKLEVTTGCEASWTVDAGAVVSMCERKGVASTRMSERAGETVLNPRGFNWTG